MGEVAERCADRVILTSDNPRGEAGVLAEGHGSKSPLLRPVACVKKMRVATARVGRFTEHDGDLACCVPVLRPATGCDQVRGISSKDSAA
jgi:hypothetical protein